jgi:uncharacterized protein
MSRARGAFFDAITWRFGQLAKAWSALGTPAWREYWRKEWKPLALVVSIFLAVYYLPVHSLRFQSALMESLHLAKWYAQEHVLLCLIPAFFIAGAIAAFVSQGSVMKYLGAGANKVLAYSVGSVSGTLLAVCSCTVLPLFAGIYRMGAGLGPASAFLYSGPAVNVLAIILTARVLGPQLGIARAAGAVVFGIVIGLLMHLIFRKEELAKAALSAQMPETEAARPLWQNALFFGSLVAILVFATWGAPAQEEGFWHAVYSLKWMLVSLSALALAVMLVRWFDLAWQRVALAGLPVLVLASLFPEQPLWAFVAGVIGISVLTGTSEGESQEWFGASWSFAKQIMPLLFIGVLVAGALLGRPGEEALIPSHWVAAAVGGNSLAANFFASFAGAFMYFATLTEIPILQGLIGSGMGPGPALALLLAGPALSLPNMLVIRGVMGTRKTIVYILLVVTMATISGMIFGYIMG